MKGSGKLDIYDKLLIQSAREQTDWQWLSSTNGRCGQNGAAHMIFRLAKTIRAMIQPGYGGADRTSKDSVAVRGDLDGAVQVPARVPEDFGSSDPKQDLPLANAQDGEPQSSERETGDDAIDLARPVRGDCALPKSHSHPAPRPADDFRPTEPDSQSKADAFCDPDDEQVVFFERDLALTSDVGNPENSACADAEGDEADCSDDIVSLVRGSNCSVRLSNAISRAVAEKCLPVQSIRQYMSDPQGSFQKFLHLRNIGRKSARELHDLVIAHHQRPKAGTTPGAGERDGSIKDKEATAVRHACEVILRDVPLPDALLEFHLSTRLEKILRFENIEYLTLLDLVSDLDAAPQKMLSIRNCGRKTARELVSKAMELVEEVLDRAGVSSAFAPVVVSFLQTHPVSDAEFAGLRLALESRGETQSATAEEEDDTSPGSLESYLDQLFTVLTEREQEVLERRLVDKI